MATPSLALVPSGYKAGKLYSVLPTPTYGSELVVNGDFATDTDWTKASNWTISGGQADSDGVFQGGWINQNGILGIGQVALLEVVWTQTLDVGTNRFRFFSRNYNDTSSSGITVLSGTADGDGSYVSGNCYGSGTFTLLVSTTNGFSFKLLSETGKIGSIDNVSVKEVLVGDGDFDVTRASTATRVNEAGLIETVANNVPRIDYTDGGCPVLLTEPQSTNLVTYPLSFDNAYWTKSGTTVVSGRAAPSVDYPTSAYKLVEDTSTGTHRILNTATTVSAGSNITYSLRVQKSEITELQLSLTDNITGDVTTSFNLNNNTYTTPAISGEWTLGSAAIKELGNGYVEISLSGKLGATRTSVVSVIDLSKSGTISYTGDGTSGVYIYGAQLEQLSYPTSLIYNGVEGSTVTRVADGVTQTGLTNVINSVEGVLYLEASSLSDDGTNRYFSIDDGSSSNYIYFRYVSTSNTVLMRTVVSGVTINTIQVSISDSTAYNKFAFKWKSGDYAFWINGVEVGTDSSATIFSADTLSEIEFSFPSGSGTGFPSKVKDVKVYNTILTDSELATLTTN